MTTETNAERLKRIRRKFLQYGDELLSDEDFWFLNEQAERAQELESYCEKSANFINQVKLEKENACLKKALKALAADVSRNGKYGSYIPKGTGYEIGWQIDDVLKGASK